MEISKKEKYKSVFKESKIKVKSWEGEFFSKHQRKPTKEEMKTAPDQIRICYKNCWKIKKYLESSNNDENDSKEVFDDDSQTTDMSSTLPEDSSQISFAEDTSSQISFSGVFNTSDNISSQNPCADISNLGTTGVWGKHLNHKPIKTTSLSSYEKLPNKLAFQLTQVTSSTTRTSLKKRKNKFQSFTGTLGNISINDNSQDCSMSGDVFPSETSLSTPATTQPPSPDSNSGECQLFPSLVTGKVVSGPVKIPVLNARMERKVDVSWLERCAGVEPQGEGGRTSFSGVLTSGGSGPSGELGEVSEQIGDQVNCQQVEDVDSRTTDAKDEVIKTVVMEKDKQDSAPIDTFSDVCVQIPDVNEDMEGSVQQNGVASKEANDEIDNLVKNSEDKSSDSHIGNKRKRSQESEPEILSDDSNEGNNDRDINEKIKVKRKPEIVKKVAKKAGKPVKKKVKINRIESDEEEGCPSNVVEGKRKRSRESEAEILSDDSNEGNNDTDVNEIIKVKRKPKIVKKVAKKAGKPVKKKVKIDKIESDEEEEGCASNVVEGPTDINLFALGFEEDKNNDKQKVRKVQTAQERLENKVISGKASENFIKIDIKKKTYTRGKKNSSGEMAKRAEFKRKVAIKEGKKVKEFKCYRCGELGHFSRQCTGHKGDALIPVEMADEFDPGEFPTLEEAKEMATGVVKKDNSNVTKLFTVKKKVDEVQEPAEINLDFETADDAMLLEAAMQYECAPAEDSSLKFAVPPLISSTLTDRQFVYSALAKFGYEQFREGQEEAIMRILAGQSSLVLLATGTGKSLIYQLPALLYREKSTCITLVVSPLVSLMEDQVTGLPPFLKAAALHYNMTAAQKDKVVEQVKSGKLHFLLVSPEAVAGGSGAFGALLPNLPPIAFVCIDEAHCVSHWSHNFRPSYLRLSKIIREKLRVKTILGLTATAPESVTRSVAEHLGVPNDGVIRGPLLPGNLTLTVSKDLERDKALLYMLTEGSLATCDSVIIYCTRREVCERLATVVRTQLQARDFKLAERRERKTRVSATAEPYHAGMSSFRRKTVQNHFMSGKLRIVVATVAFGMGIDKSDIRAIVHYNMPRTFESYIQEIGRAGRDGKPAMGHLFLDSRGGDLTELKRHIFANSMDRHTLRKFLQAAFPQSSSTVASTSSDDYQEIAVSVDKLVEQLDLPEENISTLLCYLENYNPPYIKLSNPVYCMAKVQCYGGPRQLRQVAAKCPPLAAAIALLRQDGDQELKTASSVEFQVVEVSAKMGWDSAIVKKELKNLEWHSTPVGWKKTGVLVEFSDLSFHFYAATGLEESQMDELQEELYTRVETREKTELWGLTRLFRAFTTVAYDKQVEAEDEEDKTKSDKLKSFIKEYFEEPEKLVPEVLAPPDPCQYEDNVRADIRAFVCQHQEHNWTGRAVARVFHGIQSPNYPAKQWGRVFRSWRSHLDVDFRLLVKFGTDEILSLRGVR